MTTARAAPTADQTIRHDRVEANGITFHVARSGDPDRPLLLMLHGFPECWYSWRHQMRAFADRFHCVAPDLRGYGETDKPETGYDLDTLAADAAGLVRALGRERAVVCGHDWGGAITWHVAATRPEVCERAVVCNAPPADVLTDAIVGNLRQLARSWYIFWFQLPLLPERRLTADDAAVIPRVFMHGAVRRDAFSDEDLQVYRDAMLEEGAARGALAYYRAARERLLSPRRALRSLLGPARPPSVKVPFLLCWGRDDPFLGIELTHGLEKRVEAPYSVCYIPDCGHWTQQEAADEVNAALEGFIP